MTIESIKMAINFLIVVVILSTILWYKRLNDLENELKKIEERGDKK